MKTDADIMYAIEVNTEAFVKASRAHAGALVRMCNRIGDGQARMAERQALHHKDAMFAKLLAQVESLASHGHPAMARIYMDSAIRLANAAEQVASVQALDALPMEAA